MNKFLTLTLDPKKLPEDTKPETYLRSVWNDFRQYLRRQLGTAPHFICVVEYQRNGSGKSTVGTKGTGLPHLHILLDRHIDQRWISFTWSSLGGGQIVDIRQANIQQVVRYVSKYLTKELLLSAPKGTRRLTTSRSIKLFARFVSEIDWQIERLPVTILYRFFRTQEAALGGSLVHSARNDEESFLECFEVLPMSP